MLKPLNAKIYCLYLKKGLMTRLAICLIFVLPLNQCQLSKQSSLSKPSNLVKKYDESGHSSLLYQSAKMEYAFTGKDSKDFLKWQKAFRPKLIKTLGLELIEKQNPGFKPKAELLKSEDIGFAVREYWHIWTEPTVLIPFILLRPKSKNHKLGLVITPHGHGKNTELYAGIYHNEAERESGETGERNVAIQAVKEGYIAIAPTTRGFGDTRSTEDLKKDLAYSCRTLLMHDLLVGRTPIGDRVWDVSKIIDWALLNLPIDKNKIIVTGNSGGGTITLFAAACDTRIKIAIPSSYFCTFTESIGTLWHCDCNYIPGILQFGEMSDIAGLIAPRPFCAVQGKTDTIFPIEASKKAFNHLQKIYTAAGASEKCELYIGSEGHRYYKAGVWPFVKTHIND